MGGLKRVFVDLKALIYGCISRRKRCIPRPNVKLERWAVKMCESRHFVVFSYSLGQSSEGSPWTATSRESLKTSIN